MGLFSKKPSMAEKNDIQQLIFQVQASYRMMFDGCGVEVFVSCKENVINNVNKLIEYENKYSSVFKPPKPSANLRKIKSELPECEHKFVDYTIQYIEKKLLKYSTERGKKNNFKKETDLFMYYADKFLPETVKYFTDQIENRFSQYL